LQFIIHAEFYNSEDDVEHCSGIVHMYRFDAGRVVSLSNNRTSAHRFRRCYHAYYDWRPLLAWQGETRKAAYINEKLKD